MVDLERRRPSGPKQENSTIAGESEGRHGTKDAWCKERDTGSAMSWRLRRPSLEHGLYPTVVGTTAQDG